MFTDFAATRGAIGCICLILSMRMSRICTPFQPGQGKASATWYGLNPSPL